ncbi:MAG: ABC transporter ATP-binding protein [Lachnospiraceae bacterium]|nr:ABC transporter ATP-binding protein [Lachnospiraceae bacterium]
MNAIEVRNLVKKYNEHTAVKGIDFDVKEGELFAFLGENGAGKSTTINILCTILEKTSGEVNICSHTLGKDDDAIRKEIGIVFQNSVLDDKLTVKENLFTRGSYYGLSKKQIEERLEDFYERFELGDIMKRKYEKLSGGQRRRVDIVRALLNNPKILFLDEPTTGLDPKSRKIVWEYIDYLRREKGMTIFLTTHYMEETRDANHVVILDKGEVIAKGTPAELKSSYASSKLLWYAKRNEENDRTAGKINEKIIYDADHYNILFENDILDVLNANKDKFIDFEIIKGSMDDVFLNLTGRTIAN